MSEKIIHKGKKNIVISVFSEIIILALGLIVPRLFISNYGSEINGLIHSTAQFLQYLTLFEAGIGAVMTKALYKPLSNDDKESVSSVYWTGNNYYLKIVPFYILSLIVISVVYCLSVESSIDKLTIFFVVLLSGLGNALTWMFVSAKSFLIQADGNYYFISLTRLLITCLSYIVQIVCIVFSANIVTIKTVGLFVTLCQIIVYNLFFKKKYFWVKSQKKSNIELFKDRKYYFLHQIANLLFSCTDMVLLTYVCSLATVSVYSTYNMIIVGINTILSVIVSSVVFILGQTFQQNKEQYAKMHDNFKTMYMLLAFTLASSAYILFCPFMKIYIGDADVNYVDKILALLFSGICMINSTRVVDNNLASFAGFAKETLPHMFIELLINIVLSLTLVWFCGIYGVLIGTISAIFVRYIISCYYTEKKILKRRIIKGFLSSIINFVTFGIIFLIERNIEINVNNYLEFFIVAIIVFVVVATMYISSNLLVFKKDFINSVKLVFCRRSHKNEKS